MIAAPTQMLTERTILALVAEILCVPLHAMTRSMSGPRSRSRDAEMVWSVRVYDADHRVHQQGWSLDVTLIPSLTQAQIAVSTVGVQASLPMPHYTLPTTLSLSEGQQYPYAVTLPMPRCHSPSGLPQDPERNVRGAHIDWLRRETKHILTVDSVHFGTEADFLYYVAVRDDL